MRKLIFILIITTAIILPAFVLANGDHGLSVDDVLTEIMASQNVDEAASINCQEVTSEQFEDLGDSVMGAIHPDEQQHEFMDQMMGGEGSESLRAMHVIMGENYLGCGTGVMGGGMMGGMDMMSMMGNWSGYPSDNSFNNMMYNMMGGWGAWSWFGWIFMVTVWVFLVVLIVVLIKWLIGKNK